MKDGTMFFNNKVVIARTSATTAALTATLGLAAASWVVAVRQMNGMDMGVATQLGSFAFFVALWVAMMAAMMLPGSAPACLRRAHARGLRTVPLFVGSYLAVWTLVGLAVYALYRPHGSVAAGAVAIAAGLYELTPLKQHFRRRCLENVRSGFEYGLYCVGSSDGLMRRRQDLPWVRIDKDYHFATDAGTASLADLFGGRSQLLIYHFMFGPEYTAGCPSCSAIADGFDGSVVHLANHDVTLCAVSRAPLAKLQAYKRRMGWSFPWAPSFDSDFNYDFQAAHTKEQWQSGVVEYNFRAMDVRPPEAGEESPTLAAIAASVGTDWPTYRREMSGVSPFAPEDGAVYHTYSAYERGLDVLWGMYQWLDRAPLGRNETGFWGRRPDG